MSTTSAFDHATRVGFGVTRYSAAVGWFEYDNDPWCHSVCEEFATLAEAKDWAGGQLATFAKSTRKLKAFGPERGQWHASIQRGKWRATWSGADDAEWEPDNNIEDVAAYWDGKPAFRWDDEGSAS